MGGEGLGRRIVSIWREGWVGISGVGWVEIIIDRYMDVYGVVWFCVSL